MNGGYLPELGTFLLDLNGQFSCWGKNKGDGTVSGTKERLAER